MGRIEKLKSFWAKFKHKYRLSIYRDETYEEVLNLKLSKLNVLTLTVTFTLVFLAIVISIIVYTPVKEFIPGYPDANTISNIYNNAIRLDSLEVEITKRDRYFENMKIIFSGGTPEDSSFSADLKTDVKEITFNRSYEDSLLRQMIEQEGYNLSLRNHNKLNNSLSFIHFFPPVRGVVTNTFNSTGNHYGVDIVSSANEVVNAILDGIVIISTWTLETGWLIEIQHENNLISVYKHNAELWKKQGDVVKAGDPVAIIGNSGELTTGPHLHFELWYNMTPINPMDYIVF